MSSRTWIYAGLAVAAGVGVARLLEGPRLTPGTSRVLVVGDSLAVGLGPYFADMGKPRRISVETLAQVGTRIDQWATNGALLDRLSSLKPTLVIISLGTNDAYMQGDSALVERQRGYLRQLLGRIRAAGADYLWIGPPTLPAAKLPAMLTMIREEIPSAHYFASSSGLQIPRGPDGLHPTARGYAGWAAAIWLSLGGA